MIFYTTSRDEELYHHGVKGMKWGVRRYQNSDGTLTKAGRKRLAKKINKNTELDDGYPSFFQTKLTNMPEIKALHEQLTSERKKYHDTLEFSRKFYSDPKLVEKYQEKAARKFCKDYDITDKDEINNVIDGYKYDDLDQGRGNSFSLYCKDKNVDYDEYVMKTDAAEKQYNETCRKYTDELLKEYGSTKIKSVKTNRTVSDMAVRALSDLDFYERAVNNLHYAT